MLQAINSPSRFAALALLVAVLPGLACLSRRDPNVPTQPSLEYDDVQSSVDDENRHEWEKTLEKELAPPESSSSEGSESQTKAKIPVTGNHTLLGTASWYGPRFHGKKTASGETYNQNAMTAAHRTLPMGTKVKVTNSENGKSVVVTINDRGPRPRNRVIDVSKAAGDKLGISGKKGVCKVQIEVLD